uniref:Uncharacterized protein n=1 Tax=Kalanchoe fedtschenkoi TaxID=63787 RepID=A0A7N0ZVD7_KALFE
MPLYAFHTCHQLRVSTNSCNCSFALIYYLNQPWRGGSVTCIDRCKRLRMCRHHCNPPMSLKLFILILPHKLHHVSSLSPPLIFFFSSPVPASAVRFSQTLLHFPHMH